MAALSAILVSPKPKTRSFGGGAAVLVSPRPRVAGVVVPGFPVAAALVSPSPQLVFRSGHAAVLVSPAPVVVSGGRVSSVLSAQLKLPMPTVTITGFVAHQANVWMASPSPRVSVRSGHAATLIGRAPLLLAVGGGGAVAHFNGRMGMPTLLSSGHAINHGRAVLLAPMTRVVNGGYVALTSGRPVVLAYGSMPTAIARTAYSFNIKPDNRPGWNGVVVEDAVRYPSYPLTQIVRVEDRHFGISSSGVHELKGLTDDGMEIPWSWMTTTSDMGSPKKKTIVSAYIGGQVPPSMRMSVLSGDSVSDPYAQVVTQPSGLVNHRQKFGLGRKARYYAIGMHSTSGGGLDMESLELEVIESNRRV